jgi:phospholipid/cholesterol/gamma-HCH transport system ATP-binding protein
MESPLVETPLIEFKDVTKGFRDRIVLDRINLKIYENQITTIIGKSGTGKSVLLKHIIGLLNPDGGDILFRGSPIGKMNRHELEEYRSQIAYLFQSNALLDSMTVFENVAFPLRQTTNLGKKQIAFRVSKRIEDLELTEAINKYPSELSGGMQKRVALARALVTDPKIVLFDEPTTGQDPIRKNMILSMIAHYRKRFGFTAVVISHDIPDIFFISDRLIVLWEGSVGFEGTYADLVRHRIPLIDEFLQSLGGFQDELTGLLSREAFRVHYAGMLSGTERESSASAALFSVRLNVLEEALGAQTSLEVLKILGEQANRRFGAVGGFSARHNRDEILTIFPHTSPAEAWQLVKEFAQDMEGKVLAKVESIAQAKLDITQRFEIYVRAGVTDVTSSDEVEQIIAKAQQSQEIIATYRCNSGGSAQ